MPDEQDQPTPGVNTDIAPAVPVSNAPTLDAAANLQAAAPEANPLYDDVRIDAFKKNLAYLWEESITITGLPIDTLFAQIFRNAGQQNLIAEGAMIDFGAGASFTPTKPTMDSWIRNYFDRVIAKQRQADAVAPQMPEA